MTRLAGKTAVIAGGTGTVGEAVVQTFLAAGATVVVPSRSQAAIDRLHAYLGAATDIDRLKCLVGNIADASDAPRLVDEIESSVGPIDAVVASLGGTWDEKLKLVDVPPETWQAYAESNLAAHFSAARAFLPRLAARPGASYTLLGGLSAVLPIAQYGLVSVNSAAQLMMARVLIEEMKDAQVRINQVMLGYINTRARAAYARPEWITAPEVARFCAYLASSEASMLSGGIIQLGNRPPS